MCSGAKRWRIVEVDAVKMGLPKCLVSANLGNKLPHRLGGERPLSGPKLSLEEARVN